MAIFKRLITVLVVMAFGSSGIEAKTTKNTNAASKKTATVERDANTELARLSRLEQLDAISPEVYWDGLQRVEEDLKQLTPVNRIKFWQLKANLVVKAGYPVVAATYAYETIAGAKNPLDKDLDPSWSLLHKVSQARPIQYLIEGLATKTRLSKTPPYFQNDWNYIMANALVGDGKDSQALQLYKKAKLADRYFMPSQYQVAMMELKKKNYRAAEIALKSILYKNTRDASPLKQSDIIEMWNYANMALARIYYERREFLKSVRHYRKITRTSPLYYNALFEQSWALFMGGYPLHSLGALYGVDSPFFEHEYNPESKVLESIVYYWMCRYEDARNSLADFAEEHSKAIEGLDSYLNRQRLSPDSAYNLFENLVTGVSEDSLGIPRKVLTIVAERDSMLLLRDQLATAMAEYEHMTNDGIFGDKRGIQEQLGRIDKIVRSLKNALGSQYIVELKSERDHYEELYSQSQFLYVELLMSEKEQLLGRELHVSTKMTEGLYKKIRGWSRHTQSWTQDKGEFWWDEIGYHVVNVEPNCNSK